MLDFFLFNEIYILKMYLKLVFFLVLWFQVGFLNNVDVLRHVVIVWRSGFGYDFKLWISTIFKIFSTCQQSFIITTEKLSPKEFFSSRKTTMAMSVS